MKVVFVLDRKGLWGFCVLRVDCNFCFKVIKMKLLLLKVVINGVLFLGLREDGV